MCYRDLYEFAQTLTSPIDVAAVRAKIQELLPAGRWVTTVELNLSRELLYGFYLSHRNEDTLYHRGVRAGSAVIILVESLDTRWKRFVELKELMHIFDDPLQSTSSAKEFEELLAGLCGDVEKMSPQYRSERECMWMALSLCCPEELRSEFKQQRDSGEITDAEIAEILEIPENTVIFLCSDKYKGNIQYLLEK